MSSSLGVSSSRDVRASFGCQLLAGLLGLFGISRLRRIKAPERTLQTVKDDVTWLKHPTVDPRR